MTMSDPISSAQPSNDEDQQSLLQPKLTAPPHQRFSSRSGLLWQSTAESERVISGSSSAIYSSISTAKLQRVVRKPWVQDLIILIRVFFIRGLFVRRRWLFPLLLACSASSYEVVASTIQQVIGDFYLAISSMDAPLFLQVLWRSLLVVILVAFLKAVRDLAKEACALVWRQELVSFLHSWYIKGKTPYVLSATEAGRVKGISCRGEGLQKNDDFPRPTLDNPDQRVTADADALTKAFASVVHATIVVPGLIVFYTWYLVGMFGWTAPVACYLYFVVASIVNWAMLKRVVPAVYRQERAEGTFRYDHAWLRTHSESVVFCGAEAVGGRERERLNDSFEAVVDASWFVIRRHVPLYILTKFFDYLGSIINYAAVGGAILYMSKAEGKGEAEISALIARGSYSCLYLIDAFSLALRASEAATRVGGSASRVAELLRATGFSDSDARKLGPWSTNPPSPQAHSINSECRSSTQRETRSSHLAMACLKWFSWVRWFARGGVDRGEPHPERHEENGWEHAGEYSRLFTDGFDAGCKASSAPEREAGSSDDSSPGTAGHTQGRRGSRSVRAMVPTAAATPDDEISVSDADDDWLLRFVGYTVAQPKYRDAEGDASAALGAEDENRGRNRGVDLSERGLLLSRAVEGGGSTAGFIVRELTLTVRRRQNLLIIGPSGCGKTSLLRSIAGLWEAEAGILELAPRAEQAQRAWEAQGVTPHRRQPSPSGVGGTRRGIVFLPQRAYCFRGTLFEQVTYPSRPDDTSAPLIERILLDLDLAHLSPVGVDNIIGRWDRNSETARTPHGGIVTTPVPAVASPALANAPRDWASILSIGEQQRLGIARILYHRPELAFLDEGTSAVTEAAERKIYDLLSSAEVTVVSVGHRASLHALHQRVLSLEGAPDGRWKVSGP